MTELITPKLISLFWKKVDKGGLDDCWKWKVSTHWKGYGYFHIQGKTVYAHIFSYILHFGDVENGMKVLHECDNPPCVNPWHLFLGTNKDNTQDMISKGRQAKGESHGMVKVLTVDVSKIRNLYNTGRYSQYEIADQFGIAQATVSQIINRKRRRYET